jgi:hypothetical protein
MQVVGKFLVKIGAIPTSIEQVKALIMTMSFTPVAVLLVTLAGRRWSQLVGGWLAALPLTSGPLVLAVGLLDGSGAARELSDGILTGIPMIVVFCTGYRALAGRHDWPVCLAVAAAATALTAGLLGLMALPAWASAGLVGVAVAATILRRQPDQDHGTEASAWELPIRVTVTTGLVLGLSIVSNLAGPRLAGVLAAFPALACVLAAMTHRSGGSAAAIELVRGLVVGLGPTTLLFLVLAG